jgi:hypothetical protein
MTTGRAGPSWPSADWARRSPTAETGAGPGRQTVGRRAHQLLAQRLRPAPPLHRTAPVLRRGLPRPCRRHRHPPRSPSGRPVQLSPLRSRLPGRQLSSGRLRGRPAWACSAVVGPAVGPGRQADQAPSSGRHSSAPWAAPGRAGGKLDCAVVRHSYCSRHRSLWCRARRSRCSSKGCWVFSRVSASRQAWRARVMRAGMGRRPRARSS